MRVLFDNGTPRGVANGLPRHIVEEARAHGWDTLRNGELLDAAAAGFEVILTTDRNIRHQQNLIGRILAIIVLSKGPWRIIRMALPAIAAAVDELCQAPSSRLRFQGIDSAFRLTSALPSSPLACR